MTTHLTQEEKTELRKLLTEGGLKDYGLSAPKCIAMLDEIEAKDKTIRSWSGPVAGYAEDPHRQIEILRAENAALRADFERYARHIPRCNDPTGLGWCACGLSEARKRWEWSGG